MEHSPLSRNWGPHIVTSFRTEGEKNNLVVEKPDKHNVSQVTKVNVSS